MTLWLLVAVSTFAALSAAAKVASAPTPEKPKMTTARAVGTLIGALALPVLWTVYAVQVGDWRFAAIACLPFLGGFIGRALAPDREAGR